MTTSATCIVTREREPKSCGSYSRDIISLNITKFYLTFRAGTELRKHNQPRLLLGSAE